MNPSDLLCQTNICGISATIQTLCKGYVTINLLIFFSNDFSSSLLSHLPSPIPILKTPLTPLQFIVSVVDIRERPHK